MQDSPSLGGGALKNRWGYIDKFPFWLTTAALFLYLISQWYLYWFEQKIVMFKWAIAKVESNFKSLWKKAKAAAIASGRSNGHIGPRALYLAKQKDIATCTSFSCLIGWLATSLLLCISATAWNRGWIRDSRNGLFQIILGHTRHNNISFFTLGQFGSFNWCFNKNWTILSRNEVFCLFVMAENLCGL